MGASESIDSMPCNIPSVDFVLQQNLELKKSSGILSTITGKWISKRLSMISDCRFLTRARRQVLEDADRNISNTDRDSIHLPTVPNSRLSLPVNDQSDECNELLLGKVLSKKSRSSYTFGESSIPKVIPRLRNLRNSRSNKKLKKGRLCSVAVTPSTSKQKRPLQPSSITNSPPKKRRRISRLQSVSSSHQSEECENRIIDCSVPSVPSYKLNKEQSVTINERGSFSSEELIESGIFPVSSALLENNASASNSVCPEYDKSDESYINDRKVSVEGGILITNRPYYMPLHTDPFETETTEKSMMEKVLVPEWRIVSLPSRVSAPPIDPETGQLFEKLDDLTCQERHLKQENEEKRCQRLERCWRKEMEMREKWEEKEMQRKVRLGIPIQNNSSKLEPCKTAKPKKRRLNLSSIDFRKVTGIIVKEDVSVMAFGAPVVAMTPGEFSLPWRKAQKSASKR